MYNSEMKVYVGKRQPGRGEKHRTHETMGGRGEVSRAQSETRNRRRRREEIQRYQANNDRMNIHPKHNL